MNDAGLPVSFSIIDKQFPRLVWTFNLKPSQLRLNILKKLLYSAYSARQLLQRKNACEIKWQVARLNVSEVCNVCICSPWRRPLEFRDTILLFSLNLLFHLDVVLHHAKWANLIYFAGNRVRCMGFGATRKSNDQTDSACKLSKESPYWMLISLLLWYITRYSGNCHVAVTKSL